MRLPPRRISLSDTDATGMAYAGRLADIALQRLEEALAAHGLDSAAFAQAAAAPAVVHLSADYRAPVRLGQRLPATVVVGEVGESSVRCTVDLGRHATVTVVLVWVDRAAGRAAPWPPALRRRLGRLAAGQPARRRSVS